MANPDQFQPETIEAAERYVQANYRFRQHAADSSKLFQQQEFLKSGLAALKSIGAAALERFHEVIYVSRFDNEPDEVAQNYDIAAYGSYIAHASVVADTSLQ